jgi:DNA repair protein RecO
MSAHRKLSTRSIVLARHTAGEGSARVLFYTEALGLLTALAKSAREERSKLRPHLLPGTLGTFSFVQGRDVWRVTGAVSTANVYFELGERPAASLAAGRLLSALRQFIRGEGSDPYLFDALSGFFLVLPSLAEEDIAHAECIAMLRMLSALGYVREGPETAAFFSVTYDAAALRHARDMRPSLIRIVNEAIAASGL